MLDAVLEWTGEQTRGLRCATGVSAANTDAINRLAKHGFKIDTKAAGDDGFWVQFNARDLDDLDDLGQPVLPEGFEFRTAAQVGTEGAWKAHVDAWHPSTLTLEGMRNVQETDSYRADLHVLVQAPDGTLASCATIWLDGQNAAAEFEPVGTHPEYRRNGLGGALLLHGMHAAKAAGARRMLVSCLGGTSRPAARELYYGVGFQPITRDLPHVKPGS